MKRWWWVGLAMLLMAVGAPLMWLIGSPVARRATGPMRQEAYIWQRDWDDAVRQAITDRDGRIAQLTVLAAEVSWRQGQPEPTVVAVDYPALAESGAAVGLALRINAFGGPFAEDDAIAVQLADLAARLIAEARQAGVDVAEFQVDFDAATSKLQGYGKWLRAIRRRIDPTPLTITALPTWMNRDAFAGLVGQTDGYVLQVHSLERPETIDEPVVLCHPARARRWAERAARFDVRFRVALPTYGYVLAFDAAGRYLGISAEGEGRAWPAGAQLRVIRADAAAMARLIAAWRADRPIQMRGVVWFRLPIARDWLNWPPQTLAAVMAGRPPTLDASVELARPDGGLIELTWVNHGEAAAPLDRAVTVTWPTGRPLAADGQGGYRWRYDGGRSGRFEPTRRLEQAVLAPGRRHPIGWIRFEAADMEVNADVEPND